MSKMKKIEENPIEIFEKNDKFWTTSLNVAERFNKRHDDVLRAVRNLDCSDGFRLRHFAESSYQNEQKKDQPMYLISRGGFSRLCMGFTGKKAAEWKEKYIEAFDRMEDIIIAQAKEIRRQGNREYKQLKENNTAARRIGTDAIQKWVNYAVEHGTKNPNRWYGLLTEFQYDAIIIPDGHMEIRRRKDELKKKNGHDVLTNEELLSLTMMNLTFTGKAVDESLAIGGDYHKNSPMFILLKERFKQYGQMISNNLLLQNNTKALTVN